MSGKRAKQLRKLQGISITARRGQRSFEHEVARAIVIRTDSRFDARHARRKAMAVIALAVIVACLIAAVAGAL